MRKIKITDVLKYGMISIVIVALLFFSSCKSDETGLDYFSAEKHTATIVENENGLYFAKNDGIYFKEKGGEKQTILYKTQSPDFLSCYDGEIFFVTSDGKKLCSVAENGGECRTVIDIDNMADDYKNVLLRDYAFCDGNIVVSSPACAFCFDPKSGEAKTINKNSGTDTSGISDRGIYYIGHSDRTFSLYRYDLDSEQTDLVLGEGVPEPQNILYSDFALCGDDIFCVKRLPEKGLYRWDGRDEQKVFDGEISFLAQKDGKVYFSDSNEGKCSLFAVENGKCRETAQLKDFDQSKGFAIADRAVYYCTAGGNVEKCAIEQ